MDTPSPTTAPVAPTSPIVVTSGPSRATYNQNSAALQNALASLGDGSPTTPAQPALNPAPSNAMPTASSDPIISGLTNLQSSSDVATKSLLASTMAAYQNQINGVTKSYQNYKDGLESLGIEHNEAQATPELLAGQIQQATNDQITKVSGIQANMQKALMTAKQAQDNEDFKTLSSEMTRYNQLQTEYQNSIKNMYDSITLPKTASTDEAAAIYSTLQTLDPTDQESFLVSVAQKYNLPLDMLTSAVAAYGQTQEKTNLSIENTKDLIANRGKTGAQKGGTSGEFSYTPGYISNGNSLLDSGGTLADGTPIAARGADGYVDPTAYLSLYNDFVNVKGGTPQGFIKIFPVKNVNPASYSELPAAIQPKTSSSSSAAPSANTNLF